jgi:hypothetical protein
VNDVDMEMATPERLELSTSSLEGWRSIQLSYGVFSNSSKNFNGGLCEVLLDSLYAEAGVRVYRGAPPCLRVSPRSIVI